MADTKEPPKEPPKLTPEEELLLGQLEMGKVILQRLEKRDNIAYVVGNDTYH